MEEAEPVVMFVEVASVPEESIHPFLELSRICKSFGVNRPVKDEMSVLGKAFDALVAYRIMITPSAPLPPSCCGTLAEPPPPPPPELARPGFPGRLFPEADAPPLPPPDFPKVSVKELAP
jgi:hypothetical protein